VLPAAHDAVRRVPCRWRRHLPQIVSSLVCIMADA
jgi:hypothetical protein